MRDTVFVLGELNVDMIVTGKDIKPEANKEKLIETCDLTLGSSSAITATRLTGLGCKVYMVSVVGDDDFGRYCIDQLNQLGVDTTYVKVNPTLKTGVTLSLSNQIDRALLTYMGSIDQLQPEYIPQEIMDQASHIHFGSFYLQENMKTHWRMILAEAQKHGISTSFDTGWDPNEEWDTKQIDQLLAHTDLFIPNEEEMKKIYDIDLLENLIAKLSKNHGNIVIKRGNQGALMIDCKNHCVEVGSFRVHPVDTTGAGDSFNAGLIYGFLARKSAKDLLRFANACGALSVPEIGGTGGSLDIEKVQTFLLDQNL